MGTTRHRSKPGEGAALLRLKRQTSALRAENSALRAELDRQTSELEKALNATKELSMLKDSIIQTVSHELRTPLLQLKSAVSMIAEDPTRVATDSTPSLIDFATAATARLESVVQNITQLAATFNVRLDPFQLRDAVTIALRHLSRQWSSSRAVERVITSVDDAPWMVGDRGGVALVLQQLIDNAIKFSPNGGPVEIAVVTLEDRAEISVRDYGIGIAQAELDQIFTAFYQVERGSTRRFGGTGVGLTIAKMILDLMDSEITVVSEPGKGSSFSFSLPISETMNNLLAGVASAQPAARLPEQQDASHVVHHE